MPPTKRGSGPRRRPIHRSVQCHPRPGDAHAAPLCGQFSDEIDAFDPTEGTGDDAARLCLVGPLLERGLVETRDLSGGLEVDLLDRGDAADVAEVDAPSGLDRARRVTRLAERQRQCHRETGRVCRGKELLRVGAATVEARFLGRQYARKPGGIGVVAGPCPLPDRQAPRPCRQVASPFRAAVPCRHLILPSPSRHSRGCAGAFPFLCRCASRWPATTVLPCPQPWPGQIRTGSRAAMSYRAPSVPVTELAILCRDPLERVAEKGRFVASRKNMTVRRHTSTPRWSFPSLWPSGSLSLGGGLAGDRRAIPNAARYQV